MRAIVLLLIVTGLAGAAEPEFLVDDFSEPGVSAVGTRWEGFTDRVMGGRSTMEVGYRRTPDGTVLAMAGSVSLENNGGFIQVRLPLTANGTFDASNYAGIAVIARGRPGSYRIHLRTRHTRLPWQLYSAPLEVTDEWRTIVVPFSRLQARLGAPWPGPVGAQVARDRRVRAGVRRRDRTAADSASIAGRRGSSGSSQSTSSRASPEAAWPTSASWAEDFAE